MRACGAGHTEIATILYHWNSAAAKITSSHGHTAISLARMSSCPELGNQLERLEQLKRQEQAIEPVITAAPVSDDIFVKPRQQWKSLQSQCQSDRQLHIPGNGASGVMGHCTSPLGTTATMRSALASIRNLREDSPLSQKEEPQREVIRLRLRKQPSVDSGINVDAAQAVRNIQRDIKQLSK